MEIAFIRHASVSDEIIPPLHFGYLASCISERHNVIIYDQLRDNLSNQQLLQNLSAQAPDIIGLSAFTKDVEPVKILAGQLKEKFEESIIVLGGIQITLMPDETFEYFENAIDYGFSGESEIAFPIFIDEIAKHPEEIDLDKIPNLIWKKNNVVIVNPQVITQDLDEMPMPRWDLVPPGSYPKAPHGAFMKQFPIAPIITTRGCAYSCTFCAAASLTGKKVRFRSIDNIINEIKYLSDEFGVREIHFEDDNFSLTKKRVVEFSERLLEENLGITWAFPNGLRLNNLDLQTLKLMRKAGCYAVNVGVESGNDSVLARINKKITKKTILGKISLVKKAGLDIGGFFIIGFPGETLSEINDTLKFACQLPLDRIGISYFQPYPGTKEYEKLFEKGEYRLKLGQSKQSLHKITYVPQSLTARQLKRLRLKGFVTFYFRPKIILKLIRQIESCQHLWFILKRGVRWFSN